MFLIILGLLELVLYIYILLCYEIYFCGMYNNAMLFFFNAAIPSINK